MFVNPSSSARCTQLPRAIDKVPFFEALKRVRDHIRAYGTVNGIDRTTVTFPDFKLVTAPQKVKKEVKSEPTEVTEGTPQAAETNNQQAPTASAKVTKPRKSRAKAKKEKPAATAPAAADNTLAAAPMLINETSGINHMAAQPHYVTSMPHHQQAGIPPQQMHNGQPDTDFNIKREVADTCHDKELAAIIQQTINAQHSMLQQQQSMAPGPSIPHSMNGVNPSMVMPSTAQSTVKQERSDWNGYGVMPSYNNGNTPTSMSAYPQYSCYWSYLPTTNSFMTNGYSGVPAPQIAHQQAVAAAAALHTSVAASQPNTHVAAPPVVSYNSPQEASSPAMSSQSNLTQASLDSLPKADSASTVASWLQSIPHS